MFRYITPIILIGVGVTGFFMYTNPLFSDISKIKSDIASYNEALDNAKSLENERDKLTKKYNTINPDDLTKLQKLLPDNVDNIRLILEIEKIALPYGMVLKNVKYDSMISDKSSSPVQGSGSNVSEKKSVKAENKGYGEWTLSFSTEGTYSKFISFIKDLENNLRIVDISSISFSSDTGGIVLGKVKPLGSYEYNFSIKTYWLKN